MERREKSTNNFIYQSLRALILQFLFKYNMATYSLGVFTLVVLIYLFAIQEGITFHTK